MGNDKTSGRLISLIDMGEKVLKTRHSPGPGIVSDDYVDTSLFQQWRVSSVSFLKSVFGDGGVHYHEYEQRCRSSFYGDTVLGVAILKAAKEDVEGGYLQKIELLVSASVFSDFLEIAEHLLENGYKDPAASLVGAVLEDGLRHICNNNNLIVKTDDNISSLNKKIADKEIYNRLQQREIEVWNKLRDYADHGHFSEYDTEKVKSMLSNVRSFLSNYLS